MARNKVQNIRSNQVSTVDGSPKLPTSDQIEYGELAVNYAKGKETISLKNSENEIIALSMHAEPNNINDITVDGVSVLDKNDNIGKIDLSGKQDVIDDLDTIRSGAEAGATAVQSVKTINGQNIVGEGEVTLEGTDIVINTDYEQVDFDESFASKLENGIVAAGDTIQEGIHKVEEEVSTLTDVVLDNEIVVSETINNIVNATGIVNNEGVIGYQQKTDANYINNATSVHDATVILDAEVKTLATEIPSDVVTDVEVNGESVVSGGKASITTIPTNEKGEPLVESIRFVNHSSEEIGRLDVATNHEQSQDKNIVFVNDKGNIDIESSLINLTGDVHVHGNIVSDNTDKRVNIHASHIDLKAEDKVQLKVNDGQIDERKITIDSTSTQMTNEELFANYPTKMSLHTEDFKVHCDDSVTEPHLYVRPTDVKIRVDSNHSLAISSEKVNIVSPEIRWVEKVKQEDGSFIDKEHLLSQELNHIQTLTKRLNRLELLMSGKFVDLGLPSGKLWAKCNLGAETEEGYGLYFQWGDVEGRTADEIADKPCDWEHAPFNNGSSSYDESYFNAHKSEWLDGDVLKPEYDAATQNMGEGWKMPTKADYDELLANTTNEWVEVNGVNGRRFTGTNGNSIFIPAAGYGDNGSVYDVGGRGNVWSNSLYASSPLNAYLLLFNSSLALPFNLGAHYYGFSVRPVSE